MKQVIIAVGVVIVMFVLFTFRETLFTYFENTAEYQKAEVIEVIEEEEVPAWMTDEEAIEAAQAVIDRKNTEAELKSLEASFEASTAIYEAEASEYKAKKIELEKKLNLY